MYGILSDTFLTCVRVRLRVGGGRGGRERRREEQVASGNRPHSGLKPTPELTSRWALNVRSRINGTLLVGAVLFQLQSCPPDGLRACVGKENYTHA